MKLLEDEDGNYDFCATAKKLVGTPMPMIAAALEEAYDAGEFSGPSCDSCKFGIRDDKKTFSEECNDCSQFYELQYKKFE